MSPDTIVIWGAGAIGGTLGAYWARSRRDVLFVDIDADHVRAIREKGITITGPFANFAVRADACLPRDIDDEVRQVMLCVKAQHTSDAARAILPKLAPDGFVVSFQNGLNEKVITNIVDPQRTVGAFVNFGADYIEPGVIHYGGHGAVVVGELDGGLSPRAQRLQTLLMEFDTGSILTDNIWGYLWSKLAYGALLFATALTNDSIADCLAREEFRPLFLALAREVLDVAADLGICPEEFDGFNPNAFCSGSSVAAGYASLDGLVAHNRRSAKTHSGIWRDLSVRRRPTEVDAQMGAVVKEAIEVGRETPITERLIELVHDVETGRREQGTESLAELASATA